MRTWTRMLSLLGVAALGVACDRDDAHPGTPTAATLGEQRLQSNAEYLAEPRYAQADAEWGEQLAMQCRACHTLEAGAATLLGPNLSGLIGRRVASVTDFEYSQALSRSNFLWTPRALDAWLTDPARFLPDNHMVFAGLRIQQDRDALIAYLLRVTDGGVAEASE